MIPRAAGAVMFGKLNMLEMAYGITSANPHFGPRARRVAAQMVCAAMGSDTGGSVRIPAAFCVRCRRDPTSSWRRRMAEWGFRRHPELNLKKKRRPP